MKVYAYYQNIAQSKQGEEFACANWWKTSWTNQGWEPVMLNRSHALGSPLYNKLQQKLMSNSMGLHPELLNRFDWMVARFIRWCALYAAGGGWMTDYDVVNKRFTPEIAKAYESHGTIHINGDEPAYIFYATKEHCANAIKKFVQESIVDGNKVVNESEILGVENTLSDILDLIHHAKSSDLEIRSQIMLNALSDERPI